jgi:hypothetical protein
MFSAIRSRITYVNVVATLVLVFAMTGGALAAKKYLITSTKQISPSVLKQLQGKAGGAGTPGTAGTQGAQGAQGPAGPAGAKGENGAPGEKGKDGTSVTSVEVSKSSATCSKQGGSEFTAAEGKKTTACNGKEGSPWTAGGTLPAGKTETGAWAFTKANTPSPVSSNVPISFPIPLAAPLGASGVHVIAVNGKELIFNAETFEVEEVTPTKCGSALTPAGTAAAPAAAAGNLCVYVTGLSPTEFQEAGAVASNYIVSLGTGCEAIGCLPAFGGPGAGASTAGARMTFNYINESAGFGSWAVTAP